MRGRLETHASPLGSAGYGGQQRWRWIQWRRRHGARRRVRWLRHVRRGTGEAELASELCWRGRRRLVWHGCVARGDVLCGRAQRHPSDAAYNRGDYRWRSCIACHISTRHALRGASQRGSQWGEEAACSVRAGGRRRQIRHHKGANILPVAQQAGCKTERREAEREMLG